MAAPDSATVRNLNGKWTMNKTLSDDTQAILVLQEVGWIVRQAVKYSHVVLHIKQYDDESGLNHIDIEQHSTGGMKSDEIRVQDWEFREKADSIFGNVKGRSRFCKLDDITDEFLKSGLDHKSIEAGGGEVVNAYTESTSMKGQQWTADQVWSFAIVDGQRRHVRRIVVKRGSEVHKVMTVYDWTE